MDDVESALLQSLASWAHVEPLVGAMVLYGSRARQIGLAATADQWSDIDLHVITRSPASFESIDWARALPREKLALRVLRPSAGGGRKLSLLFEAGEVEIVV